MWKLVSKMPYLRIPSHDLPALPSNDPLLDWKAPFGLKTSLARTSLVQGSLRSTSSRKRSSKLSIDSGMGILDQLVFANGCAITTLQKSVVTTSGV